MIEPLYKKANDIDKDEGIVTSYYRYTAILQFLFDIEILAPEVTEDLYPIIPLVEEALKKEEELFKKKSIFKGSATNWNFLKASNEPEFKKLKEAIEKWALKYYLTDKKLVNGFYINTALDSLRDVVEGARFNLLDKRKEDFKDLPDHILYAEEWLTGIEVPQEIIEKRKNKNYISLSKGVLYVDDTDEEVELLNKATGHDKNYYRLEWDFPFVFAPSAEFHFFPLPGQYDKNINSPETYETPYLYDYMKGVLLYDYRIEKYKKYEHGDEIIRGMNKPSDDLKAYAGISFDKPWNESSHPVAWDPRVETWGEFENRIDELYRHYKAAYKKRTEDFFKQVGYEVGKEKQADAHFEWFVRYQVQGWSKERIAREYHTARQNVSSAIEEIARLVCLEPRPTVKGGRPQKKG